MKRQTAHMISYDSQGIFDLRIVQVQKCTTMHPAYDKATLTVKCQLQELNRHQIKSHTNLIYSKKLKSMKVLEADNFLMLVHRQYHRTYSVCSLTLSDDR